MSRLTATRALELTFKQWLLMLQGEGKWSAAVKVAPHIVMPFHLCFLCEYSRRLGDEAKWDHPRQHKTCPHCPCYIVSGHCMTPRSPYRAWIADSRDCRLTEMVISQILGVQAEWKRMHGRKK